LAEPVQNDVQRGIGALHAFLGPDVVQTWLTAITPRYNEAAAFGLPLPVDYTGVSRRLRIGFPSHFPRGQLALQVTPSPWLQWPHAMEDGMCLHGFGERPITGTPETIVSDSLKRLAQILGFAVEGSDPHRRTAEFQAEITSYWSKQLKKSSQSLLLLKRPTQAGPLYALSDPRREVISGCETLWLSDELSALKKHHERVVGVSRSIRELLAPAFYVKLQSYPPVGVPKAEAFFEWLTPHLDNEDLPALLDWLERSDDLPVRWAVLELPGEQAGPLFCFNLRSKALQPRRGPRYGLRAGRRQGAQKTAMFPAALQVATLDLLERAAIHSRERAGMAADLEHRRVVLVGLGSLGSPVAMLLAKAGVGHLTLIDPDKLVGQNLGRHALGMDELGKSKAGALRMRLQRDLPTVQVEAYNTYIEVILTAKSEVLDRADLIIVTSAEWGSEVALWRAKADGAKWPLMQAWSEPNAFVGHALVAIEPTSDGRRLFNERGDYCQAFTQWPDGGVVPLPACGESFIPGGATGLASVVSMVVNSAIRVLRGRMPAQAWMSSISTPDEVIRLGGHYRGPRLETGQLQVVLERDWPPSEDRA
jgi:hypothetical protein